MIGPRESLTYGELNRRANRLAHRLRALGVGPESVVALGMERSVDLVVSMLGALKASGAYLPLDPSLPVKRRLFMLRDAQPQVVLTRQPPTRELADSPCKVLVLGGSDATTHFVNITV